MPPIHCAVRYGLFYLPCPLRLFLRFTCWITLRFRLPLHSTRGYVLRCTFTDYCPRWYCWIAITVYIARYRTYRYLPELIHLRIAFTLRLTTTTLFSYTLRPHCSWDLQTYTFTVGGELPDLTMTTVLLHYPIAVVTDLHCT